MCGFLFSASSAPLSENRIEEFRQYATKLASRGNTGSGEKGFRHSHAFHYRLAFRDLVDGAQPMLDAEQKKMLVFNGELYRFRELRNKLDFSFRTDSDTEVILAAMASGKDEFLTEFDGEFAFAYWDENEKCIYAARDPFGIKPIYVGMAAPLSFENNELRSFRQRYDLNIPEGEVHIASEMKGLPITPKWDTAGVLRQFCSLYEEIATPFRNIIQIPPGGMLRLKMQSDGSWRGSIDRISTLRRIPLPASELTYPEAQAELRTLIEEEVNERLDADVPLGSYLSGGIDSRIITHNMIKKDYKHSTFTVGFEDAAYDEVDEVKKFVDREPNLDSYLLRTSNDALDYAYEHAIYASELIQPYTNGAAKWWLSKLARRYVRGVLTGDGSDEVFCGYPSYKYVHWWQFQKRVDSPQRRAAYRAWMGLAGDQNPWEAGVSSDVDGSDLARSESIWNWAHPLFWQVESLAKIMLGEDSGQEWVMQQSDHVLSYIQPDVSPLTNWQNYFLRTHFPTHVLNWVGDRMEMANTLEGRPPFLSQRIWNFASRLPDHYLVRGFLDKAILRHSFESELGELARTPKKQFNAPFLYTKSLGKKYLDRDRVEDTGIIPWNAVERALATSANDQSAMKRSYANIFLQNTVVFQLLDDFLVRGNAPERNHTYEDEFLDTHTEKLN